MPYEVDLLVIGAGPGGYVAAIHASQLGMRVACVEKEKSLGGTCLNIGCIPSKALLDSSHHYFFLKKQAHLHGIQVENVRLDLASMQKRKEQVVQKLTQGIAYLFKKNKVQWLQGTASFLAKKTPPFEIRIHSSEKEEKVLAQKVLIATGSVPASLPSLPFDGTDIVSSTEALSFEKVPSHLIVVGAGFIGLELGSVWARLGAQVTVVEYAEHILPAMDQELVKKLENILHKELGMRFLKGHEALAAEKKNNTLLLTVKNRDSGEKQVLEGEKILVATGRRPYTEGLSLEHIGLKPNARGFLEVNHRWETAVAGVYAIGDVIGGPMLAHKAEEEGIAAVECIAGRAGHVSYAWIPSVLYTHPEFAAVGKSEEMLQKENIPYKKGVFPLSANGRALAMGEGQGWVKVLAHAHTDRLLGVHILAPSASDLIAEATLAMEFMGSSEDIAITCHAHPTLPEALKEAALAVSQKAIHI